MCTYILYIYNLNTYINVCVYVRMYTYYDNIGNSSTIWVGDSVLGEGKPDSEVGGSRFFWVYLWESAQNCICNVYIYMYVYMYI